MDQDKSPSPKVVFRTNKYGRQVLYIERTEAELEQLLRTRLGILHSYKPYSKDHPIISSLGVQNAIVTVDSMETACRIAVTRILHGKPDRRHLFLDGLRLMSIRLNTDTDLSTSLFTNAFQSFDDLYVAFGFVEVQNKLNQETLMSVVDRRLAYGMDCWLFVPPADELSRRYGVSLEGVRYKTTSLTVMDRPIQTSEVTPAGNTSPPSTFADDMGHFTPRKKRRGGLA